MLFTPQTMEIPAHMLTGVAVAASRDYEIPGLPVTRLPKGKLVSIPMHRVNARTMRVTLPAMRVSKPVASIHFGFNRWKLTDRDKIKLFDLPIAHYRVTGYASPPGSRSYNLKLSEKRAKVAADFLKSWGSRVQYRGAGVPAHVHCPVGVSPQHCLPDLREDKVVITRISPRSVLLRMVPTRSMAPESPVSHLPIKVPPVKTAATPASGNVPENIYRTVLNTRALWKVMLLHPGDLRDVAAQIHRVTGYGVHVDGPAIALHDMGMPWHRTVPAALVIHKLSRQPFIVVRLDRSARRLSFSVNLTR
ncbi:OmpA family protein [Acidithiobacillus sp. M4-SHS-6]|uniref:OmpA family protein n=1 Tax=Acidithiobacillus sp. M4-SHS-6 TaxID=3383024 RepID=UPI0039BE8BD5